MLYRDLIDNNGQCQPANLMKMAHTKAKQEHAAWCKQFGPGDKSYAACFQEALLNLWGWIRALQFNHCNRLAA